ncbi:MAG: transposase [Opitutales bacterium]|nr:transposase [Opitutales bacterium]
MHHSEQNWNFFNPRGEVEVSGVHLPHWQQGSVVQFITFRLGDSLPSSKLRELEQQNKVSVDTELLDPFEMQLNEWLDKGLGSCLLSNPEKRIELTKTLISDEGKRARFISWIVMPNHVHVLCEPLVALSSLLQSWKSISAHRIDHGSIWQSGYYDRMARDMKDLIAYAKYIRNNPKGLPSGSYTLWESYGLRMEFVSIAGPAGAPTGPTQVTGAGAPPRP